MNVLFDAVKNRAIVSEEATVCISTAALQSARLTSSGREGLQVQGLGMRIRHVYDGKIA